MSTRATVMLDEPSAPVSASTSMNLARASRVVPGFWLLVSVGIVTLSTLVDIPLARWFQSTRFPGEVEKVISLSEAFSHGGGVLLIVLTVGFVDVRGWRVAIRVALSAFGAGLAANLCKLLIPRLRPQAADLTHSVWDTFSLVSHTTIDNLSDGQSFPSAHTATAFGLAFALGALCPRGRIWFFALATLAGLQRLEVSAHFLSDVVAGAALGLGIGMVIEHWGTLAKAEQRQ